MTAPRPLTAEETETLRQDIPWSDRVTGQIGTSTGTWRLERNTARRLFATIDALQAEVARLRGENGTKPSNIKTVAPARDPESGG